MRSDVVSPAVSRLVAVLAAALLLIGAGSGGGFDPPTDVTFRYTTTATRDYGAGTHSFMNSRLIRFQRTADDLTADVTPTDSSGDGSGDMFLTAMSGLRGRTLRFHLDRDGRIGAVDDGPAHWQAFLAGIKRIGINKRVIATKRSTQANQLWAGLRLTPPTLGEKLLSSLLLPVIGVPLPAGPDLAEHRIRVSASDPEGGVVWLDGTERVTAEPGGILVLQTDASGDLAATAKRPAAHLLIARTRRVDTRTGLVLTSRDRRETIIGDGPKARRSIVFSTAALTLVS